MNIELVTFVLIAIVLLLSVVCVLFMRHGGAEGVKPDPDALGRWALGAIAAAYNVAVDELKTTGELPDGATRRRLAVAYYDTIPSDERTFTVDEFAEAVDSVFTAVDWGASRIAEFLQRDK